MTFSLPGELRDLLERHAPQIAHLSAVSDAIDNDALMQAVQGATDLTEGQRQNFADLINAENAEMARAIREATENGRAAGVASVQPAADAVPAPLVMSPGEPEGGPPA